MSYDARARIAEQIADHVRVAQLVEELAPEIESLARELAECLRGGHTICWMGNGGSAADSQHLAAEFVGRFMREREGLASLAFTTDSSVLTAVANDFGFEQVFARQVEALCRPGDVVIGISTSGGSANVLAAIDRARERGVHSVGLTGGSGGELAKRADRCLVVPSGDTQRIQEAHIMIGHILCDVTEQLVLESSSA